MSSFRTLLLVIAIFISPSIFAKDMGTVLVTGANRGLGLAYAEEYISQGYQVIGTARKPAEATELKEAGARVMQLDVTDAGSVKALAEALKGQPIDILINNAGYLDRSDLTLDKVNFDTFERTLAVNTLGPLRVTKALIGNVKTGKLKKVISMSSQMGSITNSSGRYYSYRTSKTALNQINKILSKEFEADGIIFTVVHPGWVQTDMGGESATYTPMESVDGLVTVINSLTIKDSGKFYDLHGKEIPW